MPKSTNYLLPTAALFFFFNLLVSNDYTTLWSGPESFLAWRALHGEAGFTLHEQLMALPLSAATEIKHIMLRLPSILILLFSLPLFYWLVKPLFGKTLVENSLLLLAASLLVANLAKVAAGDIWAMVLQWTAFAAMLRYLKQPALLWQLLFYSLFALALWVQPLNSLLFILGSGGYLYFVHPDGKRLWRLNPWIMGGLTLAGGYMLQWMVFSQHSFYLGFHTDRFLLANLVGILPFLGFALAGVWESIIRARKGEELSIIFLGGFLFALLAHAPALQLILVMLAAKQLKSSFLPNYPYRNIVLTGAVLQLVTAACMLIIFMMGIFVEFRGLGYRAALAAGGIYWMLSFVGVVGYLGNREIYAKVGVIFSGLLFTSLFWLQLNPLVESQRNWVQRLPSESLQLPTIEGTADCLILPPDSTLFPNLAAYAKAAFPNTVILDNEAQLKASWEASASEPQLYFLPVDQAPASATVDSTEYKGWINGWEDVEYVRIIKQ
jgi:hypothetical protein